MDDTHVDHLSRTDDALPHEDAVRGVGAEIELMAALVDGKDFDAPVPACPEWDLAALVTHTGSVHRWATQLLATKATEPVARKDVALHLPVDRAGLPAWLAAGAAPLLEQLAADPAAAVWSWGPIGTVGWWARRMLHESAIHRADAQLALGLEPELAPAVAADGIEELLANLPSIAYRSEALGGLRGDGESLHLHATDAPGEWTITLVPGGFTWNRGHVKATVAIRGAVTDLALLMHNRRRLRDPDRFDLFGDAALAERWLAATCF